MNRPTGQWVDVDSPESIQSAVETLVDDLDLSETPDPLVLPELSYPFHPSTGLVANPDVVAALVSALQESLDANVGLAYAGSQYADGAQTASLVGYDDIADGDGVDVIDLESADAVERTVSVESGARTVTVPTPLVDRPVIVVPTLRYGSDHPIVGGMVTVARHVPVSATAASSVAAAARAVDPAGVVLDGTYTHTGQPHETGVLIAGTDVVDVDHLAAWLVDVDAADVPALEAVPGGDSRPTRLQSLPVQAIRNALPNNSPPETETPGSMVRSGYRLYTRLTGDAYPPQFDA